jgi:transcriptional regulator with XRE-family HTH domain
MEIGHLIRKKRLALGATLEQVAFEADMDASNLSRIERGLQQPSSVLLKRIAGVLGVSVGQLYGEPESNKTTHLIKEDPLVMYGRDTKKMLNQFQQLDTHHRELAIEFIKLLAKTQNKAEA